MKIKKGLPRFERGFVLIITLGKQTCKLYIAGKGAINLLRTIRVFKPRYSDREGLFKKSPKAYGAVYESKEWNTKLKLASQLGKTLKETGRHTDFRNLILFCPAYMRRLVNKKMPVRARQKKRLEIYGNYSKHHPFELLKMIKQRQNELT